MAEKNKKKSINLIVIIIAIVVIALIVFGIVKVVQNNNWKNATEVDQIEIKESDSDQIKVEKMQKKIELLNKDIGTLQEKLNQELEKMNGLYVQYVDEINKYQTNQ